MPARNELAQSILDCLAEIAGLLERAGYSAMQQRDALTANDAEMITVSTRDQEEILRRIAECDQRAAAVAGEFASKLGLEVENVTVNDITDAAGHIFAGLIKERLAIISDLAAQVRQANEVNRQLLENGLDIIVTCLRTVASEPTPNAYSSNGQPAQAQTCVLSLDSKA